MSDDHAWSGGLNNRQKYDKEELRRLAGVNPEDESVPNYKCQICGKYESIDDHQRHTPNWCGSCESVTTFEKIGQQ